MERQPKPPQDINRFPLAFSDILNPPLRKVSVSLMTREEKAQMRALVELMVNLNINYTWSKGDVSTGRAKLMLDPPLSELATFGRKGEGIKVNSAMRRGRKMQRNT